MSNENPPAVLASKVEIPFSTTLLVRDTCLCLHVQRAARVLARRFDRALEPVGLTNGQFSLLMSLNRPDRADMPGIPLATVGSVVKADVEDRRTKVMKLTAEGKRVLAAAVPIWEREHGLLDAELGFADGLRKGLRKLCR
jgi:hypothetical protein